MSKQAGKDSNNINHTWVQQLLGFSGQHRAILSDNGQATVEFIVTLTLSIGISFLFIAHAINSTKGYLAHYANFMASRVYLVYESGLNTNDQNFRGGRREATETFNFYGLDAFGIDSSGFKINDGDISRLFWGTTFTFSQALSPLSVIAGDGEATFHTESFLGKEPSRIECMESICEAMTGGNNCTNPDFLITLMDNGC